MMLRKIAEKYIIISYLLFDVNYHELLIKIIKIIQRLTFLLASSGSTNYLCKGKNCRIIIISHFSMVLGPLSLHIENYPY